VATIKFTKEFLKDELDLPYSAISDTVVDNSRWSLIHEIVFETGGKFYKTNYSEGATEMQDERAWDDEDEIECIEVEKKMIKVEVWVPVIKTNERNLI